MIISRRSIRKADTRVASLLVFDDQMTTTDLISARTTGLKDKMYGRRGIIDVSVNRSVAASDSVPSRWCTEVM